MLEQILIMMVQYVDTAMVGAIGPNATAAVALTSSTNWLMNGIIGGAAGRLQRADRQFYRRKAV